MGLPMDRPVPFDLDALAQIIGEQGIPIGLQLEADRRGIVAFFRVLRICRK